VFRPYRSITPGGAFQTGRAIDRREHVLDVEETLIVKPVAYVGIGECKCPAIIYRLEAAAVFGPEIDAQEQVAFEPEGRIEEQVAVDNEKSGPCRVHHDKRICRRTCIRQVEPAASDCFVWLRLRPGFGECCGGCRLDHRDLAAGFNQTPANERRGSPDQVDAFPRR